MRLRLCVILVLLWPLFCFSATPLPEPQVFQFSFSQFDANTLKLDWSIKPGYFLYQERFAVTTQNQALRVGSIQYPEPQIKVVRDGQQVRIYRDTLTLAIPLLTNSEGEFLITVHYQGCSDEGFCYPPQHRDLRITFDRDHAFNQVQAVVASDQPVTKPLFSHPRIRSSDELKSLLSTANPLWVVLSFFGFGLLLAFTPCVLPMVPVLSGIIIGHGHQISTRKAFLLSLSYVLSMSVTYGIIGAIIALLGANLQVLLQSPWVIGAFAAILVLLALSMFNVYEFRLPISWQSRIASITRSHEGGHYVNAAIMGAMSILILSPCVTPPLIGALSYIADAGSVFLGLLALFFLGLGMGTPLLLIGASAGKLLPKTGQWMNIVKYIFGMIMLGLAIHLLSRLISPLVTMLLWSALFITSGLGLKTFFGPQTHRALLMQAIGLMLIIFGGFILYGASAGHTNPWQPLSQPRSNATMLASRKIVTNLTEAQHLLAAAAAAEQPVLLDFYATWCESCQQIEKTILRAPDLIALKDRLLIIQVNLSKNDANSRALLKYFNVIAPPTFLFYDNAGNLIPDLQWVGVIDLPTLLARIQKIL